MANISDTLPNYSEVENVREIQGFEKGKCMDFAFNKENKDNRYLDYRTISSASFKFICQKIKLKDAKIGDLILFKERATIIHYAIITKLASTISQIIVKSKWGGFPVFEHKIDDSPYNTTQQLIIIPAKFKQDIFEEYLSLRNSNHN